MMFLQLQVVMCLNHACVDCIISTVVIQFYNLPIRKESGPPEVLLTHMAKKSRSAQAVSIFYDSSWVLPRGCPCHSHLKNIQRRPFIHEPTSRGTDREAAAIEYTDKTVHQLSPSL